ncbi:polyprenol monophosphomannose synthase [Dyella caseinilytica]|uniref:Polyprenol monophosphomannose synthase n=1 Tax=Dyella caseinilytica TaxID=1849581 RepID=A0ABX7GRS3_9GAMM|nr:polyprenol monophosphomannose synthase [Dyella caseinilytica]QRN53076.1 polyprenol monophosphomannose synthase [Dyella caseinilytica]GGA11256.1 glycosyl transferase [Dyella caseinilytica]
MTKTLVFFATYNEAGNINPLISSLENVVPEADILVVDDNSSDGTADIILGMNRPSITLLQRKGKLGLGTAHLLALSYAQEHGYDVIITMDGDLSHDPAHIPSLLDRLGAGADLVIGSRYMPGGGCDYTGYRLYVSRLANIAARSLLGMKLHEFTTSYRAFRVSELKRLNFAALLVGGYSFFLTTMVEASVRGLKIQEAPIQFRERGYGTSKLPPMEAFRGMTNLLRIAINKATGKLARSPVATISGCPSCGTTFSLISSENIGTCVQCGFQSK